MTREDLSLHQFRMTNVERCLDGFKAHVEEWSPTDWACALAGEVGELCNLVKKMRRGESVPQADLNDEAADVLTYLDLLCERLGIDLAAATRSKFNRVSERVNSAVRL